MASLSPEERTVKIDSLRHKLTHLAKVYYHWIKYEAQSPRNQVSDGMERAKKEKPVLAQEYKETVRELFELGDYGMIVETVRLLHLKEKLQDAIAGRETAERQLREANAALEHTRTLLALKEKLQDAIAERGTAEGHLQEINAALEHFQRTSLTQPSNSESLPVER